MPAVSRFGDKNDGGGAIMRGASTVFCNGIPVGLHVSQLTPHGKKKGFHPAEVTTAGSPTVFAEGSQVLRVGSGNTNGHKIIEGSKNTFVP